MQAQLYKDLKKQKNGPHITALGIRYHIGIPETYITKENFDTLYGWLNNRACPYPRYRIILGNSQGTKFPFMITYDDYVEHRDLLLSFGIPQWRTQAQSEAPMWHAVDRIADLLSKALVP